MIAGVLGYLALRDARRHRSRNILRKLQSEPTAAGEAQ